MICLYGFIVGFIIIHHCLLYKNTTANKNLSIKQRSYILSIQTTLVIVLVSLYYNIKFLKNGCDIDLYINNLNKDDNNLITLSILYLTAYFLSDCIIGTFNYKSQLCMLAGYPHHIVYSIINYYLIKWGYGYIYILFLIAELPTLLMGLGTYDKNYRNDMLFGITFFITRILIQIIFTYIFRYNKTVLLLSVSILPVHLFWFYKWCKYYLFTK